MLRSLKKFTVYSSVIVVGKASRALDDAPFAGQDESEDAEDLLRLLSACDDDEVNIFGDCYDPDETFLRVPPASPTAGAPPAVGPRVRAPREHVDDRGAVEARERPVGLEDGAIPAPPRTSRPPHPLH